MMLLVQMIVREWQLIGPLQESAPSHLSLASFRKFDWEGIFSGKGRHF